MQELRYIKNKHGEANLDSCFRVASLGKLGAMLGKLPSLKKSKRFWSEVIILHYLWSSPDPLMVDGVKSWLAAKWRVSTDGTSVVLGHLKIKTIINGADFHWETFLCGLGRKRCFSCSSQSNTNSSVNESGFATCSSQSTPMQAPCCQVRQTSHCKICLYFHCNQMWIVLSYSI